MVSLRPMDELFKLILTRKGADSASSYTASLFSKGRSEIAKKIGEEGVETALAAVSGDTTQIIKESADVIFHLCVLWADAGLTPADIMAELERRQGVSGHAEKASRES